MSIKCPCINCDKKGCGSYHDECEEFQEYIDDVHKRKDIIRESKAKDYLARSVHYDGVSKANKKKR